MFGDIHNLKEEVAKGGKPEDRLSMLLGFWLPRSSKTPSLYKENTLYVIVGSFFDLRFIP